VVRAAASLFAALLLLACAGGPGGVDRSRLPESPVALLQRPEEQALRRLDALRDLDKRKGADAKEGVVVLENLDAMFGGQAELERRLQGFQGHLVLLDPRTGETRRIENAPPQARPSAWSPDRRRLLISGSWRDRRQLFAWERETGRVEIVTAGPAHHVAGCYAAGERLVAAEVARESLTGAPSRLMASAPAGGALRALGPEALHLAIACSPTEPQIAFTRLDPQDGRPRLLVQTIDPPGEPREVAVGTSPAYTPDGAWIVYVARTTRGPRLHRVRPDGAGRTPLGAGVTEESQPTVSPDGQYVAYVVTEPSRRERVWVRRIDGTGDRPLVTSGDGSLPVW
jgi:Tol biopolymer transport system component